MIQIIAQAIAATLLSILLLIIWAKLEGSSGGYGWGELIVLSVQLVLMFVVYEFCSLGIEIILRSS